MDTPNISSSLPVAPKAERPVVDAPPPQQPKDVKIAKVESVDPIEMVKNLEEAVDVLNEALAKDPVALKFSIDEILNRPVVSVISETTGEVIHQLPQDEVMRAVKNIDRMRGILFEGQG